MAVDIDVQMMRYAVADVLREIQDYAYQVSENHRVSLDVLSDVFDDQASDKRLIQAVRTFLADMPYYEGFSAQLDAALDALRNAPA